MISVFRIKLENASCDKNDTKCSGNIKLKIIIF